MCFFPLLLGRSFSGLHNEKRRATETCGCGAIKMACDPRKDKSSVGGFAARNPVSVGKALNGGRRPRKKTPDNRYRMVLGAGARHRG